MTQTATPPQTDRLPFFVYGTLRHGQGNYSWSLKGRTTSEKRATLTGAVMLDNGGFPYVFLGGESTVVGEVMTVPDDLYDSVQASLDRLEGYVPGRSSNHYDRIVVTVTTEDGEQVQAYTYVVSDRYKERYCASLDIIRDGDWVRHDDARAGDFFLR